VVKTASLSAEQTGMGMNLNKATHIRMKLGCLLQLNRIHQSDKRKILETTYHNKMEYKVQIYAGY
jgi:hypothetical protein